MKSKNGVAGEEINMRRKTLKESITIISLGSKGLICRRRVIVLSRNLFFFFFWLHHSASEILIPQPGIELTAPEGRQSLNHRTTKEVLV